MRGQGGRLDLTAERFTQRFRTLDIAETEGKDVHCQETLSS